MKPDNLKSLTKLMAGVIGKEGHRQVIKISNPQYASMYLHIFLDEVEANNGNPLGYDAFGDDLWINLGADVNDHATEAEEFMTIWNGWVFLYRHLRENNKIIS